MRAAAFPERAGTVKLRAQLLKRSGRFSEADPRGALEKAERETRFLRTSNRSIEAKVRGALGGRRLTGHFEELGLELRGGDGALSHFHRLGEEGVEPQS